MPHISICMASASANTSRPQPCLLRHRGQEQAEPGARAEADGADQAAAEQDHDRRAPAGRPASGRDCAAIVNGAAVIAHAASHSGGPYRPPSRPKRILVIGAICRTHGSTGRVTRSYSFLIFLVSSRGGLGIAPARLVGTVAPGARAIERMHAELVHLAHLVHPARMHLIGVVVGRFRHLRHPQLAVQHVAGDALGARPGFRLGDHIGHAVAGEGELAGMWRLAFW